ncbi:MAG: hypothetical protein A2252_03445 [Elusimicrobia bacterium RIFOXYA2_FULL_39_19]|nr:MAG: hypothetical protein A2252_03445 [Elusimicrobia bacterium RIFOXYA2_FULL_39_19]
MDKQIIEIVSKHGIKTGSKIYQLAEKLSVKFNEFNLSAPKALDNLLTVTLKDTIEESDIVNNLEFALEMAGNPAMGTKDDLFKTRIIADNFSLQDIMFALIRHQIIEKKIDGESLAKVQSKVLSPGDFVIYCNSARKRSSTVVHNKNEYVDSCPICYQSFINTNKKVWFWRDYYLFGNHAPIVENHLMVTYKKHGLQSMDRQFMEDIIDLNFMFDFCRPYFNRPGSLDKHRHVQAFSGTFPIENIKTVAIGNTGVSEFDPSYPATGFVVEGNDKKRVSLLVNKIMELCDSRQVKEIDRFVPFYLIFARKGDIARVFVLPKWKWKSDTFPKDMNAYNAKNESEKNEFIIVPASVETAGRGSTSDLSTFKRITYADYCHLIKDTSAPLEEFKFIRDELKKI